MKQNKDYQEQLNNIKCWLDNPKTIPWELLNADSSDMELWKKQCPRQYAINTIQELIDNYEKLEEALDNACMELEVAEVMLHKYTKGIKFSKEQWKEYLLNETN